MIACLTCNAEDPTTYGAWDGTLRHEDCGGLVVDTTERESPQDVRDAAAERRRESADFLTLIHDFEGSVSSW